MNKKKPILFIGRIIESKGIITLINAYYQIFCDVPLCNPLWIIGGNIPEIHKIRNHPEITEKIKILENQNQLFWWGHLPHNILPFVIRQCLCSCFTSKYEPGGRTILEAMACGIPVIATPYGFAEEVVIPNRTGIIIRNDSLSEWIDNIKKMIESPAWAASLGKNAHALICKQYSMDTFYTKHWKIYVKYQ